LESGEAAEDLVGREGAEGDPSESDTESSASFESSDAAGKRVQERPDSELSDTAAAPSPSHSYHSEGRRITRASATGRAETSPDTGKERLTSVQNNKNFLPRLERD
jgi:hypothetical protein